MANLNRKSYTVTRIAIVASVLFCLIMAVAAYLLVVYGGRTYSFEKAENVSIFSADDIREKGRSIYNDHCVLRSDLTISDPAFSVASKDLPFEGTFDGGGHTVYCNFSEAEGSLFGCLGEGGRIFNTRFVFPSLDVAGNMFGAIAERNYGTIEFCSVEIESMTVHEEGIFSPLVLVNNGTINNVVVRASLSKGARISNDASDPIEEKSVLYGALCVYNYGTVKRSVAVQSYAGFDCTDEFRFFIGETKNVGVACAVSVNLQSGKTEELGGVLAGGVYSSDKGGLKLVAHSEGELLEYDIFRELGINNTYWSVSAGKLVLKGETK